MTKRYLVRKSVEHRGPAGPFVTLDDSDDHEDLERRFWQIERTLDPGDYLELFDTGSGKHILSQGRHAEEKPETEMPPPVANPKPVHLDSWQCASCDFEFVIVGLNRKTVEDPPYCPECGDSDAVHKIDCLDFALVEKVQEYVVEKRLRPLPGGHEAKP